MEKERNFKINSESDIGFPKQLRKKIEKIAN